MVKSESKGAAVAVTIVRVEGIFKKGNLVFPHLERRHFHEARELRMESAAGTTIRYH